MRRSTVLGLIALVLLTACGGPEPVVDPGSPPPGQTADPSSLLGTWRLVDAGTESGAVVRLFVGQIMVEERRCFGPGGGRPRRCGPG